MPAKIPQKIANYLKLYKSDLAIVMISLLSVSCSLLMIGTILKELVDNGLRERYLGSINHSILLLYILILIFSSSSFFRSYFINNIAEKVINQIKKEVYANLIYLNIERFEELKIGDIISR